MSENNQIKFNQLTEKIIGLAIKVHRILGPGFLESVYQTALAHEFNKADISFEKEKELPVIYDGVKLDIGFRCDFLVKKKVIVECKAVKEISSIDKAQLLNYLKICNLKIGLLLNFNVLVLKDGITRLIN